MAAPRGPGLSRPLQSRLAEICDTLLPGRGAGAISPLDRLAASDLGVDQEIARFLAEEASPEARVGFERLVLAVDRPWLNLLLGAGWCRWSTLDATGREQLLTAWARSRVALGRQGFAAVKRAACFLYYAGAVEGQPNPVWPELGYGPPEIVGPRSSAGYVPFDPGDASRLESDVVVVGSGAGGGAVAALLAQRGHRVLILEAGPFRDPSDFTGREAEGLSHLFAAHGLLATDDLSIAVLAGRVAGGSTTVNWMTCLAPPLRVREEWALEHGLVDLVGPEFDQQLALVRARLEVGSVESQLNPANDVLRRGCERLGYQEGRDYARIERNARGCRERCAPCAFGCPYNAKRSSLVTYLADAVAAGARLLCETEALHLEVERGRVKGVRVARRVGATCRELDVRARTVVLCGGAIETPRLLLRSGLGGPVAGRDLHLHPTAAILGEFDHPIEMWNGPMQTIVVSRFQETDGGHGPWIESAPAHPGLAALALPWTGGAAHKARMRRVDHVAASIALVRDVGSGRVHLTPSGGVRLHYRLTRRDRENLVRGMVETARLHRAAGACRISTLHQRAAEAGDGAHAIPSSAFDRLVERIERLSVRPNDPLLFSAHPTGGAALGTDPRRAVAGPDGAVFGVDGLWIGDGSALPTAPGVNPMLSILVVARRTAERVDRRLRRPGSSAERPPNVRKAL